jgi:glycosyltransferase involved in cell wall biosynthesis
MGQRKGLGDLFAAMKMLPSKSVELVVLGTPLAPMSFYRNEYGDFIYEPTRSHSEVLKLMRTCHVFCLPSIVEGRALVMQEAMSQGLPLIITGNTGGADLIDEGKTGFLVPIRRPDKIAEKIAWFAENRGAIEEMSLAAQSKAKQLTWKAYGEVIVGAILSSTACG